MGGSITFACNGNDGAPGGSLDVGVSSDNSRNGTNSSAYTTLGDPPANATIPTSGRALVTITGGIEPPTGVCGYVSVSVDGSGASDAQALMSCTSMRASTTNLLSGLSPGSHTFQLVYRTSGNAGTAEFSDRVLTVAPLP